MKPVSTTSAFPQPAERSALTPSVRVLYDEYGRRKERNSRYSLRSFSRDIGISQSLLSQILAGKRNLTSRQAIKIANAILLSSEDKEALIGTKLSHVLRVGASEPEGSGKYLSPEFVEQKQEFDLDWIEVAVLDLTTLASFRSEIDWIARRLGIDEARAIEAIDRLERKGLLRHEGEEIRKTNKKIYFTQQRSLRHVREYHRQMISKALGELEKTDDLSFALRSISGLTVAMNRSKLEETKVRIKNFLEELCDFVSDDGKCEDLYQFNVQFFPLTKDVKDGRA